MAETVAEIASDEDRLPYKRFPAADEWLRGFEGKKRDRAPLLVVYGPSFFGQTDWVLSLFKKPLLLVIGTKKRFPALTRKFRRDEHDGIVLDDVRDLPLIVDNQDKLQGKYNAIAEFGATPSDEYAYHHYLNGAPIAVTINKDTQNLHYL